MNLLNKSAINKSAIHLADLLMCTHVNHSKTLLNNLTIFLLEFKIFYYYIIIILLTIMGNSMNQLYVYCPGTRYHLVSYLCHLAGNQL